MPIDSGKYGAVATRGEIAGIAVQVSTALQHVRNALANLKAGAEIEPELQELDDNLRALDQAFDQLTGYTAE